MSRECRKCKAIIPYRTMIDGKRKNLQQRKFCLDCSPWGQHNTKSDIDRPTRGGVYENFTDEQKQRYIDQQKQRRYDRKAELVNMKGGCCGVCGYSKNYTALQFHHRDPETKKFNLTGSEIANFSWKKVLEESEKCDLICANCHLELHHPHMNI